MSRRIWKYEFLITPRVVLTMRRGDRIVHVGQQQSPHDSLTVWVETDTDDPPADHHLSVFGTGHPIPEDFSGHHVGTVLCDNGLVWHVYRDAKGEL